MNIALSRTILFFLMMFGQTATVPQIKSIEVVLIRTSAYEYRDVKTAKGNRYLEIRQSGKTRWARVEEIKCGKIGEEVESQSFDFSYRCDFISPQP
ncbi:MAG: hypothetical protein DMG65_02210 [Candidatus Angelobacter sp. Gp1-AA117]|nr:MAG: hypothetical protein DMG65_02210 [Candidatus Angelobacter sp. Gp1-AA117]